MARYQKMSGETLSDTIKRGILMKALSNETELQKHVFRNAARLNTYGLMRAEVMSALTAERAVHEEQNDPMEIGALRKGKDPKGKGKGKKGKGKNEGSNPHADKECFYCKKKGHVKEDCRIRIADEKAKQQSGKDKKKEKRERQKDKKRVAAMNTDSNQQGQNSSSSTNPTTTAGSSSSIRTLQAQMIF